MLSPEISEALEKALSAVVDKVGDDPKYAPLVEAIEQTRGALSEVAARLLDREDAPEGDEKPEAPEAEGEKEDGGDGPPSNFEDAQKRFMARRKGGEKD